MSSYDQWHGVGNLLSFLQDIHIRRSNYKGWASGPICSRMAAAIICYMAPRSAGDNFPEVLSEEGAMAWRLNQRVYGVLGPSSHWLGPGVPLAQPAGPGAPNSLHSLLLP
ncbi:UNVERIFIED_CONTAM: hypothetical protein Sradi_7254600 [Sesamum radiatum]|uniref:Uncharacterized protein n=1 Tax=Sesamum radiatum TaxID=300843 RepID=A0AAW2ILW4_SESRA